MQWKFWINCRKDGKDGKQNLQKVKKSAGFYTWKIEESVQDVEAVGVVSLDEHVRVVFANVFTVAQNDNTNQC